MAELSLDILVIPTYSSKLLGVADISTYPDVSEVQSPTLEIEIPGGFDTVSVPFVPNDYNVINSAILEITVADEELCPIPDGVYTLTYSITPSYENYVTKNIIRVDQLQEKFDNAFMKLDMMECDGRIRKQAKVELNSIYFLIQGAIAAANNCNVEVANKLYKQADRQLDYFIKSNCGCSGTNYF